MLGYQILTQLGRISHTNTLALNGNIRYSKLSSIMRCFSGKYCSIAISAVGLTPVLAAAFATIFYSKN